MKTEDDENAENVDDDDADADGEEEEEKSIKGWW